jgi:hypothetical protein
MKNNLLKIWVILSIVFASCDDYLDIVPDNTAKIENAFVDQNTAEKFLNTCYSGLPAMGHYYADAGVNGGDEVWFYGASDTKGEVDKINNWKIARGKQKVDQPYLDFWDGRNNGQPLFQTIRNCNIFLKEILKVNNIREDARLRWIAEGKMIKAVAHYWLFRQYGPIPIVDENFAIDKTIEDIGVYREPVDNVVKYITDLINQATPDLPFKIFNESDEFGRFTQTMALALKAKLHVLYASPLFNIDDNPNQITDNKGRKLFPVAYDAKKWEVARDYLKVAIDSCEAAGAELYHAQTISGIDENNSIHLERTLRGASNFKWNSELIWGNTNHDSYLFQVNAMARIIGQNIDSWGGLRGMYAPTLRMIKLFYSKNGVPIEEDKDTDFSNWNELVSTGTNSDPNYFQANFMMPNLHLNREPRFYANIGFDGGKWFAEQPLLDNDRLVDLNTKLDDGSGQQLGLDYWYSATGYYAKKPVNLEAGINKDKRELHSFRTPNPFIKLSDLYLMYAECSNEVSGPSPEAIAYIDKVRKRAGLDGVTLSWSTYSNNPSKPSTKEGLREIIHQELLIELAFEGKRYWNLRRWRKLMDKMNQPIQGWDVSKDDDTFYKVVDLFNGSSLGVENSYQFKDRDYFWPIHYVNLYTNKNLVQNKGW